MLEIRIQHIERSIVFKLCNCNRFVLRLQFNRSYRIENKTQLVELFKVRTITRNRILSRINSTTQSYRNSNSD